MLFEGNENLVALKKYLTIGKFVGQFPSKLKIKSIKISLIVLVAQSLICILFLIYLFVDIQASKLSWVDKILKYLLVFFTVSLFILSGFWSNYREESWQKLLSILTDLKLKPKLKKRKLIVIKNIFWVASHIVFLVDFDWSHLFIIVFNISVYWYYTIISYLNQILLSHYEFIEFELKNNYLSQSKVCIIKQQLYLSFYTIKYFNEIFELSNVLLIAAIFIWILNLFNHVLNGDLFINLPIIAVLLLNINDFHVLIFIILMVRNCEMIERKYEKIIITCNFLQTKTTNPTDREELIILCNYMKDLRPKFMAFGFLRLNQDIYSKFFSTLVSYLIIIVQAKTYDI